MFLRRSGEPEHVQPASLAGLAADQEAVARVEARWGEVDRNEDRRFRFGAIVTGVGAVAATAISLYAEMRGLNGHLAHPLPFIEPVQRQIIDLDKRLVPVGEVGLPTALGFIAGAKALAPRFNRLRFAERYSQTEPTSDGASERRWRIGPLRRKVGMAMAGAALATFTASIATELGQGPDRPIDKFNSLLPGTTRIMEYKEVQPMVESSLNPALERQVRAIAASRGLATAGFGRNLGSYDYAGRSWTDLFAGVETSSKPAFTPLRWNGNCAEVPAMMDSSSGVQPGAHLLVSGINVKVVGKPVDASSLTRISGIMDKNALKSCIKQSPDAPDYGMSIASDTKTAEQILAEARQELSLPADIAPAAVITTAQEEGNSESFWDGDAKPITSVLSLAAGWNALLAMAGATGARILRNRGELGDKRANGVSVTALRLTELLRSAKDGVVAGVGGVLVGIPMSIGANFLEPGFDAGVGVREAMVGVAVGIVGSMGGAFYKLLKIRKVANPAETARM